MKQEDEQLLLKDLCSRLPYGVIVNNSITGDDDVLTYSLLEDFEVVNSDYPKPYLRSMSSMTEEELKEFQKLRNITPLDWLPFAHDWLLAHHFDYRGMIEKGLALEVTEENNPYKD